MNPFIDLTPKNTVQPATHDSTPAYPNPFFRLSVLILIILSLISKTLFAERVVNVYIWANEIPKKIIRQFEQDTGIKVNFSTYDNNETMYAKLKASRKTIYDVIIPSSYYVERMKKQKMLHRLDHKAIPNLTNLAKIFIDNDYDYQNQYSIPFVWGATGIFYHHKRVKNPPQHWEDLWKKKWRNQLLLLDDSREVFSMALISLGYRPNDSDPGHLKKAYEKLVALAPNVKLFASENVQSIIIDEDAVIGSVWNNDVYKAKRENSHINFIYPKDGFVIWVDALAIPKNPPHLKEAYIFLNYMLQANIAKKIGVLEGYAITNAKGQALLPKNIRENVLIYPPQSILKHGYFQKDVDYKTIALYNHYWEKFKLSL